MIQRRTMLLFALAVLTGGAATWLAYQRVDDSYTRSGAQVVTVPVVVAAFDIEQGEVIDRASLKIAAWPNKSVPKGALSAVDPALGKLANQSILQDEPVTQRRLVTKLGGSPLAHLIEPDKRAVTVRVNDVIGVAGFLLPGNRVDVLASRPTSERRRVETRTLLENLKVLAVDQQARTNEDDPVVVRAVTLEVAPDQAEALFKATEEGSVQLALRNPAATAVVARKEDGEQKVVVKRVYVPRPRSDTTQVTVIRGTAADISDARF